MTIRPTRATGQASLRSSAATSSTACRVIRTISSTSSSVITNGGENEIVSAAGSARVITPSSRQRRVILAATFREGSNGVAGSVPADELERPDQRRSAHLADDRVLVERVVEEGLHQRAALADEVEQASVLDQVEVRQGDGGAERMRGVGVSVAERAPGGALHEDTPDTIGDDAAREREIART